MWVVVGHDWGGVCWIQGENHMMHEAYKLRVEKSVNERYGQQPRSNENLESSERNTVT